MIAERKLNKGKVISMYAKKSKEEAEYYDIDHYYETLYKVEILKSFEELLDKKFNNKSINETYYGKDVHTYVKELEFKVQSLKKELEDSNCMNTHKETSLILAKRLDKSYPKYAVKFFIANLVCMFIVLIIGILSLFSPIINTNIIVLFIIMLCNISLMITSIASIVDWRKKNAYITREK